MHARILAASLLILVACAGQDDERVADVPRQDPELALTAGAGEVPVASAIEVHQPAAPQDVPAPVPEPVHAAPLGSDVAAAPALHDHNEVAAVVEEPSPAEAPAPAPGGGKPNPGMSDGEGLLPDRDWSDVGIIDDPNPIPAVVTGRPGAVIIRGGAGRIEDDCKIHPRGLAGIGGMGGSERPGGIIVNDRDPRRGALINERAPRARTGGTMTRGVGFPPGGIRFR